MLVQSYEMLCTARVVRATRTEPEHPQRGAATQDRHKEPSAETVRGGIHDTGLPPARMVGVEHLCVRYLWDEAAYLWLTQKQPDEERFLSCSLNLSWPDQGPDAAVDDRQAAKIVAQLQEIFDHMIVSTRVITSRSHAGDNQFAGLAQLLELRPLVKALKGLHDAVSEPGPGPSPVVPRPLHPQELGLTPETIGKTSPGNRTLAPPHHLPRSGRSCSPSLATIGSISSAGTNRCKAIGPAELAHLLDQRARDVRVLAVGHQEDRLDVGVEPMVRQGHAELVLHVGQGPQAAEDHAGADPPDVLHRQLLEPLHARRWDRAGPPAGPARSAPRC